MKILAINPGATSTKVALFEGGRLLRGHTLRHADAELRAFAGRSILDQLELRYAAIRAAFSEHPPTTRSSAAAGCWSRCPAGPTWSMM
jgi:butyrate kinase